jgi:hypothetical protein
MNPTLFLPHGHRIELKQLISAGNPTARALADVLNGPAPECPDALGTTVSPLCRAWMNQDKDLADEEGEKLLTAAKNPHSDLGKGAICLKFALALDYGRDLWSESLRARMVDGAAELAWSITQIGKGNPHIVTNNWYMITHGGCLLACLAAHGERGTRGIVDLAELEAWALGRFRAFLGHFGNAGLYHEGTGYIAYTLSILMPALVALRNRRGVDLTKECPNLRLSIRSLFTATARSADGTPIMLDWNDTGRGAPGLNPVIPGMAMAEPADLPGLRHWFDHLLGVRGENTWICRYEGLPLTLALYPFSTPSEDAGNSLPRHLVDTRQGLAFWRNQWGAGPDTVVGWYARSTYASPGHKHDDAGSIRMICKGIPWICGAGQTRPDARWQSVLTHARPEDRPSPYPLAYPFTHDMGEYGGFAGIDMRHSLEAYAERYLAWRTDLGPAICMAILDLVEEHRRPGPPLAWNLTFPKELESAIDADGAGFRFTAPDGGGTLYARFLLDTPDHLSVQDIPSSTRTFAGGQTVDFPGDRHITARFESGPRLRILVALAVLDADAPPPLMEWQDPDIRLDAERVWAFPFKGAILKTVRLGQHVSNLQRAPAGE